MSKRFLMLAAVCALAGSSWAYVNEITSTGESIRRADFSNIQFEVNDQFLAGATNADGEVILAAGSDPFGAIQAALNSWNQVADSAIVFSPAQTTVSLNSPQDNRHTIGAEDTPDTRSLVGGAIAVTLFFTTADGTIADSDIYFNPNSTAEGQIVALGTSGGADEQDIESTALHELGHALGQDHTNVQGATTYQSGRTGEIFARTLSRDDEAFAVDAYPAPSAASRFGRITGRATLSDGSPLLGGLLAAVDPTSGVTVGGITDLDDGTFDFTVPATGGTEGYLLYVEPANGPVQPVNLFNGSRPPSSFTTEFQTTLLGGVENPTRLVVPAGGTATADIAAEVGVEALEIQIFGAAEDGGISFGRGPREFQPGDSTPVFFWGPGLDQVQAGDIEVLGPAFAIRPGSVSVNPSLMVNDFPALSAILEVAQPGGVSQADPFGSLGTILIRTGGKATAATGALVLESSVGAPRPAFTSQSLVDAASFAGGGVAPGELVTIFGTDLGPAVGVGVAGFDPNTGGVPTSLAGVSVTFDGVAAPMIFARADQVNLQAPFEIAGKTQTVVVLTANGQASAAVNVPVTSARPGIFQFPGQSAGIVLNQDGQVNTPANPEAPGRVIVIFATGQGVTIPPLVTGQPAGASPLSTVNGVTAMVGGQPAAVGFAGMTPAFVGLLQVNAAVAANTQVGSAVPVSISVNGIPSQDGVTVSIGP